MAKKLSANELFRLKRHFDDAEFCEALDEGNFSYCYDSIRGVDRHILTEMLGEEGIDPTSTLTVIPQGYARWNTTLQEVTTSPNLTEIHSQAFCGAAIKLIILHRSAPLKEIGSYAFYDTYNLKMVALPRNTLAVGPRCFAYSGIEHIYLGEKLKDISIEAFLGCVELTSVTIPSTVKYIAKEAFFGCHKLKNVKYEGTLAQWQAIEKGSNIFPSSTKIICKDEEFTYLKKH